MPLPRLDDMALFVEVVRTLNFTKAAARLGMPNATLSRRIVAMERRLGLQLFDRSTRRVVPTGPALRYYERCAPLVDEARLAHEALRARAAAPEGHVRVSVPVDLGLQLLGDALPEFMRRNPGITLDLDLSPRKVDLKTEAFDLAIRIGAARGDGLVAQRLGVLAQGLYAAPIYLERHGAPRALDELARHACLYVGSSAQGERWRFVDQGAERSIVVRGPLGLNSMSLIRRLAERGTGIALLASFMADDALRAGALERVLPRLGGPGWPVYAVTTSRLRSAAVRTFAAFVAERIRLS